MILFYYSDRLCCSIIIRGWCIAPCSGMKSGGGFLEFRRWTSVCVKGRSMDRNQGRWRWCWLWLWVATPATSGSCVHHSLYNQAVLKRVTSPTHNSHFPFRNASPLLQCAAFSPTVILIVSSAHKRWILKTNNSNTDRKTEHGERKKHKSSCPTVSCTRHDAWHHTSQRWRQIWKLPPREKGDAGQLDEQQQRAGLAGTEPGEARCPVATGTLALRGPAPGVAWSASWTTKSKPPSSLWLHPTKLRLRGKSCTYCFLWFGEKVDKYPPASGCAGVINHRGTRTKEMMECREGGQGQRKRTEVQRPREEAGWKFRLRCLRNQLNPDTSACLPQP